jgi:superfamily II RNA helicase
MQVPAILFTLSRKKCDKFADRVEVCMVNHEERREIENIFDFYIRKLPNHDQYQQVVQMKQWLMKGVAVHHSGLLPILKEIIEIIFSKGYIKVLFATETFAIGINMPTKTVVFLDVTKHNGTEVRPLLVEEYKQMAGRAGRRGLDKIGHVMYFPIVEPVSMSDMQNMMQGMVKKINSKFSTTTQYVLRGLNARKKLEDASIFDVTKNTMMYGEHMMYRKGCETYCEELAKKLSDIQSRIDQIEEIKKLQTIYEQINDLKAKATQTKKNQRQLLRQADDLIEKLSKVEKRNYDIMTKLFMERELVQKDLNQHLQDIQEYPDLLRQEVMSCVSYLTHNGYIIPPNGDDIDTLYHNHLTLKGIFANEINQCDETVFTEAILQGHFHEKEMDSHALCVLFACFIDDNERYDETFEFTSLENQLVKNVANLVEVCEKQHHNKTRYGIRSSLNVNTRYTVPVSEWCQGEHFETICQNHGVFEGNMIRALTKLVNLLDEVRKGFELIQDMEWVQKIDLCKVLIQRDVLVTDSIYLTY